jgi:glycosyltransferase involved in cell wall biosynthesis
MPNTGVLPVLEERRQHALNLFREEQYSESAQVLAEILKEYESSELWNDWATAQVMCRQAEDSEQGYWRALDLDPQNSRAAGNLGVLLANNGRGAEAAPLLERAVNGSSGWERERLLELLQTCREQMRSTAPKASSKPATERLPLLQGETVAEVSGRMATIIFRQSQMIGNLWERVAALEAKINQPSTRPASTLLIDARLGESGPDVAGSQSTAAPVQSPAKHAARAGIFFRGYVYGGTGFSEETWMEALGLDEHGIAVQLSPVLIASDSQKLLPEESRQKLKQLESAIVDLPRSVIFQCSMPDAWELEIYGRCRIGRAMFETDTIPYLYQAHCNAMDEVWVPSRFNLETFAAGGVDEKKLRLVPSGVDAKLFRPGVEPAKIPKARSFKFLSIFDWIQRKGYDVLLRAYLSEFSSEDDVALILKVYQTSSAADVEAEINFFIERELGLPLEKAATIILINGYIPQDEMPGLYAAANCFVLPTRGEGYGRPYLEALACQLPVIATNWSGQRDFLNKNNSYLIESKLTAVPASVDFEVYAGHRWAEPSIDHLRHLMRQVYSRPEEARRRAERGREDILRNYDWTVVIPRWVSEFQRLLT